MVYYPYTVTNTGNDNNTFTLTAATGSALPNSWTATIYVDANDDGIHQGGETTVTGTTGILIPGGTYRFFVGVTIPLNTPNGSQDDTTLNVNGTGAGAAATAQDNVVTTAQAPVLTIVKAARNVTTAGAFGLTANAKPNEVIEYRMTVTNGGTIAATAVVLTDPDHTWTTYVPDTIYIGSNGATSNGAGNVLQDDDNSPRRDRAPSTRAATRTPPRAGSSRHISGTARPNWWEGASAPAPPCTSTSRSGSTDPWPVGMVIR